MSQKIFEEKIPLMRQFIFFQSCAFGDLGKNCMYASVRCYSNICYESCKISCFQCLNISIQVLSIIELACSF